MKDRHGNLISLGGYTHCMNKNSLYELTKVFKRNLKKDLVL
jgi:hypothetical protein